MNNFANSLVGCAGSIFSTISLHNEQEVVGLLSGGLTAIYIGICIYKQLKK